MAAYLLIKGCHGPMGYRLEECDDSEARWWLIERDGVTLQGERYHSRAEVEAKL
jgi:hypothetical protein